MVYFKAMQKNHPNGRFCVRNHRSKIVSEKFRGGFSPLTPHPGSAYEPTITHFYVKLSFFSVFVLTLQTGFAARWC